MPNAKLSIEEFVALVKENGEMKAAKIMGVHRSSVYRRRDRLVAAGKWPDGETTVPEGQILKGKSTLRNAEGQVVMEWEKTSVDEEFRLKLISEAVENICKDVPARPRVKLKRKDMSSKLMNMYTFTDYHLGMLAWHEEGGDNWNTKIAIDTLKTAFGDMIDRSPAAKTCVINQLGDFMHWDSLNPMTPTSGHLVDADTRPERMIDAAIECLDYLITEAAKVHEKVTVVVAQGNHDLFGSLWLKRMFIRLYRDNPRVEFVDNKVPFYAFNFGKNLLGFHHGHKVKFGSLPALFADEFRHLHGKTERTFIHMGHYHHKEIKEVGKATVEMHRTLAARDSHASYGGYHSERASDVITYHADHGEYSRITVYPSLYGDC